MESLKLMFQKQKELNTRVLQENKHINYKGLCNHKETTGAIVDRARVDWLLKYNRAQLHEMIELENSLPWKWWKKDSEIDWFNVKVELVDELHFFISKCQLAGIEPEELVELYLKKNDLNHHRQDHGYGGDYQKYDENGNEDNTRLK